jgi:protein SCO1/2
MMRVIDSLPGKNIGKTVRAVFWRAAVLTSLFLSFTSLPAFGQVNWEASGPQKAANAADSKPAALRNVGIDQKLDQQVPLDLPFRNENGEAVKLGDYFGRKPVLLALVYYSCPMLCNQVLQGLAGALTAVKFDVGNEFDVLAISFDPRDTPELAAEKKEIYVRWYKRQGAARGWHFLTGEQESITRLTEAVGFRYWFDEARNQFAHASGIMLLTSQGKLARYFYGIEYAPKDIQLGLVEASANKIGSPVDQLLLYCYHYDPATGTYSPIVLNMVRVGGLLTVLGLPVLLFFLTRRYSRREREGYGGVS